MAVKKNIPLPPEISNAVKEKLTDLQLGMERKGLVTAAPLEDLPGIQNALGFSEFIFKTCSRQPGLLLIHR